ncbi:MAG: hypothetical protein US96_C0019G0003 [Candidatus Woesebacteria bacterium GW2011_GWB1_38_5b]|uniref:Uncharacterized protein n=1 Tax=Candidatus Woesebacteria bacterium GW2011_GWB1_38_5b TaxID=1618569 RepID=A0A0G0MMS0_9BACT|nr:MAG: hypothetical protein US96_C0019G0003 [Candidatus Woesebacteria bacterium GW2011_GWB1_38_5b]OGH48022.1 MAG: hypothetical protein A3A51_02505 [Candidatus Levybacteria bacterium RIFCSPLOWO2_01_FULL_39_10]
MKEVEGYIDHKKMLFLDSLLNARFGDLFEGDELESFHKFLDGSARNAGGFVIAFPTIDLQMVWVSYEIDRDLSDREQIVINLSPKVHLTPQPVKPEALAEIPVWWHIQHNKKSEEEYPVN